MATADGPFALEAVESIEEDFRVAVLVEHDLHQFVNPERDTASCGAGAIQAVVIDFAPWGQNVVVDDQDECLGRVDLSVRGEVVLSEAATNSSSDVDAPSAATVVCRRPVNTPLMNDGRPVPQSKPGFSVNGWSMT